MKHILIEGGDGLGKNTLIQRLCEYYDYNNVTIRHFDKPPKGLSPKACLDFQFNVFHKEAFFVNLIKEQLDSDDFGYHENIVIWNRSHLGEFVYSQMFRGISQPDITRKLRKFEQSAGFTDENNEIFLISLTASSKFFFEQEDGDSFSQSIEEKTKELELFKNAFNQSNIKNKLFITVNKGKSYKSRDIIFGEVLELLGEGTTKLK